MAMSSLGFSASPPQRSISAVSSGYNQEDKSIKREMSFGLDNNNSSNSNHNGGQSMRTNFPISALSTSKFQNHSSFFAGPTQQAGYESLAGSGSAGLGQHHHHMDLLLTKLTEKTAILTEQGQALDSAADRYSRNPDHGSSSNSLPITPATETFPTTAPATRPASATFNDDGRDAQDEVLQLRLQLARAESRISTFKQELARREGSSTAENEPIRPHAGRDPIAPRGPMATTRGGDNHWASAYDDGQAEVAGDAAAAMSAGALLRGGAAVSNPWASARGLFSTGSGQHGTAIQEQQQQPPLQNPWTGNRAFSQPGMEYGRGDGNSGNGGGGGGGGGPFSTADVYRAGDRNALEPSIMGRGGGMNRRGRFTDGRFAASSHGFAGPFGSSITSFNSGSYGPIGGPSEGGGGGGATSMAGSTTGGAAGGPMNMFLAGSGGGGGAGPLGMNLYGGSGGLDGGGASSGSGSGSGGYQSQQAGTSLSPHAAEFTSSSHRHWRADVRQCSMPLTRAGRPAPPQFGANSIRHSGATEGQIYLAPTEPLNYRRLLDRTVSCNWTYIVDKIVCNNDQQASIFLQQKLKVSTPEQKYEIVEAIVAQAYPLMVNRFGNFLVQRCFEHGTPEQVIKIAEAIRGSTLTLSMDPFGCHVVQKAFDSVPEDYKAVMVHELLRRIPDTVVHRYACHVWQKLFELRWHETPPQIMKFVNDALRGMWHEVALGETGSLVVQNIFENCLEEDKRPCIEAVLAHIDIVAHGQFGNWCIQHICEHGAPADRGRAVDHVIRFAAEYSTDQFASKVVEKCLKIGGAEFLAQYLERVTSGTPERPRIPLIDIASDQYGNYLVQYILTHASAQHREMVISHIRKHMVSLRGSKFGSRVGMLCSNPAISTRPGPGMGQIMGPTMGPGMGGRMGGNGHGHGHGHGGRYHGGGGGGIYR